MKKIYIPTADANDWQNFLAEPQKQWRTGFSARALAYSWESENGSFPAEVEHVFKNADDERVRDLEILLAFPEWKVYLPPRGHASQNDLFVLAKGKYGLVTIMVEGKVSEKFGETLEGWLNHPTSGKLKRLEFIQTKLGLNRQLPKLIRYQLLHRTVSALLEAERFRANSAVMLVHSFNQQCLWFEDYQAFLEQFGIIKCQPGKLYLLSECSGVALFSGWVTGNPQYLQT